MVKAHVEGEAMVGQIIAHLVGGTPADILAEIGADNLYALPGNAHAQKGNARPNHIIDGPIGLCGVDEEAHDLWIEQIEANATEHEDAQYDNAFPIGAEILG